MQKAITNGTLAVLALAAISAGAPAAAFGAEETDTGVCTTSDTFDVFSGPASGEVGFWINDCIVTSQKDITVTFHNADAVFHNPHANGGPAPASKTGADSSSSACFDPGNINAGRTAAVRFVLRQDGNLYTGPSGTRACSSLATQPTNGVGGTLTPDPLPKHIKPVIERNDDGSVTIHYICGFHGPSMHGTITLGAPAS